MQLLRSRNRVLFFVILFLLYGVLIIQYLHNRSVWNDEAYMVLTITNLAPRDLLLPLDYYQVAPVLFLQIEKLLSVLLGHSEYALRLFPLLCALAAVPLFYSFCLQFTRNRLLSLFAMILLAVTPGLIYYSSEVKQYCPDLFVVMLLYNVAFNDAVKRRTLALSITGIIAVFLSNVSIITLFTIGLYYLYCCWKTKKIKREYWIPALSWTIAFACNYLLFIKDHPHTAYMKNYWQIAFMPVNIFSSAFHHFVGRSGPQVFSQLLPSLPGKHFYLATAFLFFVGLFFMFREKKFLLLHLCLTPILIHLGLSAMHFYPFEQRLLLYQAPLYVFGISFGVFRIIDKLIVDQRIRLIAACICLALISFKSFMYYPMEHDEIKQAIKYINAEHTPGESIYIFSGAVPGIKYYMQRDVARFNDLSITFGKERVIDKSNYLENIPNVHGHVWLVASHIFPFRNNLEEETAIANAIRQRGKMISKKDFTGSTVYLFDMP